MDKKIGKGLEGMFQGMEKITKKKNLESSNFLELEIEKIIENSHQPRTYFDDEELISLSASIKENGVIQPLIVIRRDDGFFELIAGERRLRASKLAGLMTVPVVVKNDIVDEKKSVLALIENIQRADLNPVEISFHMKRMMDEFSLNQEALSKQLGIPRTNISNYLRLVNLPNETIELLKSNLISYGHAKVLLSLKDNDKINELAHRVKDGDWSVAKLTDVIKKLEKTTDSEEEKKIKETPAEIEKIINKLSDNNIKVKYSNKKIVISLDNDEEILNLLNKLV